MKKGHNHIRMIMHGLMAVLEMRQFLSSYEQYEDTAPAVGTLRPYEAQIISVK